MRNCFIVCPIGESGTTVRKRSDQVLKYIIEPVCKAKEYLPTRCDKIHDVDKIDQTIIANLEKADLVIADLSDHNPNAFFELGYRTALRKPLIHVAENGQALPFDVLGIRTIFYDLSDPDKIEECKARLAETVDTICTGYEECSSGSESPNKEEIQQHAVTQILSQLLELKYMLVDIKNLSETNNSKVVEQIVSVFANQMQANSSPQDKAMEWFFKEYFRNPQKMMLGLNQLAKMGVVKHP